MKLNKKGYMLVEIIIASVLAFGIAYYLLNLTYKFKNTNSDISESIIYENTKNVITKNIMNDLEKVKILIENEDDIPTIKSTQNSKYITFLIEKTNILEDDTTETIKEYRKLEVSKNDTETIIKYGKTNNTYNLYYINDVSYYEKKLPSILSANEIKTTIDTSSFGIEIPLSSIYDDNTYNIKIFSSNVKTNS